MQLMEFRQLLAFLGHQARDTLVAVAIMQALDLADTEVQ